MEEVEVRKNFVYDRLLPKLDLVFVSCCASGWILLWNQISGGDIFCIVGLGGLAEVYFLRAFEPPKIYDEVNFPQQYFNRASTCPNTKQQSFFLDSLAPKVMYISSACVLIGILFKLMFWKGAQTQLLAGMLPLAIFTIVLALNQRMNRRALVIAVLGGLMLSISTDDLMRQLYRDDPRLVELMVYQNHHPYDQAAQDAYAKRMREYRHNH